MEELFFKIFNLSLLAGAIVLVVLPIRLFLRFAVKTPKWVNCLLWGIVALRLIVPFTFATGFGILPANDILSVEAVQIRYDASESIYENSADRYFTADVPVLSTGIVSMNTFVNEELASFVIPEVGASVDPIHVYVFVAACIWIFGMAAMLIYMIISRLLVGRRVREAIPYEKGVMLVDSHISPFILGIIRPTIYLSASIDSSSSAMVLAHERAHISRLDHVWKPLGFVLLTVYWFNPLLWLAYVLMCRDLEMACDEKVIADMKQEARKEYSEVLLSLSMPRRMITACPVAFGEVGVKDRIRNVLNYRKPALWIIISSILVCTVLGTVLLTGRDNKNNREANQEIIVNNMVPSQTGITGWYADYVFIPIAGESFRYRMFSTGTENYTRDRLLLECREENLFDEDIEWKFYSIKERPDLELIMGIGLGEASLFAYSPALGVPEQNITDVTNAGFVVMENGSAISGKDTWEEFVRLTENGEAASVNLANVYRLREQNEESDYMLATLEDYPSLFCSRLTYDGEKYILEPLNKADTIDGDYVVYEMSGIDSPMQIYKYMMHYTGEASSQTSLYKSYDRYVLTDDNTVTWEKLLAGLYSSQMGAYIPHHEVYCELEWK